jgi:hypothetical protein
VLRGGERVTGVERCVEKREAFELQGPRVLGDEGRMDRRREALCLTRIARVFRPEVFGQANALFEGVAHRHEVDEFPSLDRCGVENPASVAVSRRPLKNDKPQRWKSR